MKEVKKMARKNIFAPGILFTIPDPQPTTVVGGGTGQSTTDPYPCSYSDWLILFSDDYDLDGTEGTRDDYMQWWNDNNFSMEAWKAYNGETPFQPPAP
jgi:hypothetical protein